RVPFVAFHGLDTYELSLFFTIFVFLQFWNMFNARAFASHGSALNLKGCGEFILIAALIIVGQILIINVGGAFFSVEPISLSDWAIIICSTSSVLWIGEIYRLLRK
ncbi:MAG: cation transporting ATPase C-terminal domain-containing protein, partial [Muribaculaceae bacterium]|nr:cation transporting ATPase C-terminal domain-containing protein [Muribaculaceae bacterium]